MNKRSIKHCLASARSGYDKHPSPTYRLWAYVFQDGNLIEHGTNRQGMSGLRKCGYGILRVGDAHCRHTLHAETVAYNKAVGLMDKRRPWSMLCIRLRSDKSTGLACPCNKCHDFLVAHGCSKIVFSCYDGKFAQLNT